MTVLVPSTLALLFFGANLCSLYFISLMKHFEMMTMFRLSEKDFFFFLTSSYYTTSIEKLNPRHWCHMLGVGFDFFGSLDVGIYLSCFWAVASQKCIDNRHLMKGILGKLTMTFEDIWTNHVQRGTVTMLIQSRVFTRLFLVSTLFSTLKKFSNLPVKCSSSVVFTSSCTKKDMKLFSSYSPSFTA